MFISVQHFKKEEEEKKRNEECKSARVANIQCQEREQV